MASTADKSISTGAASKYYRSSLMTSIQVWDRSSGSYISYRSALDYYFTGLMMAITKAKPIRYAGEDFSYLSYTYYGNTSEWWIIAMYNGVVNPLQVKTGKVINIPDSTQVAKYFSAISSSTSSTSSSSGTGTTTTV